MSQILARLAAFNFLALLTTFGVGLWSFLQNGLTDLGSPAFPLHLYLGLFAVIVSNLGLHCLVFIYFLGTGRWVKEVAIAYRLPDVPLPKLTRELKRRTFPVALLAMLVPITTAAVGAGQKTMGWPWGLYLGLGLASLFINLWANVIEVRNVRINTGIIDQVMQEVERIRAEHGLPTNEEALQQEEG
jgi:hypothetical protein